MGQGKKKLQGMDSTWDFSVNSWLLKYVCDYVCIAAHGHGCVCVWIFVYMCMSICSYSCVYFLALSNRKAKTKTKGTSV